MARLPDRGAGPPRATTGSRKIADRLELLDGYLIAYLNLDRVIQIIRAEDEPKPVMIAEFALTDRQAEAILNMRLRVACASSRRCRSARSARGSRRSRPSSRSWSTSPARQRTRLKKDLAALARTLWPGDRARPPPHR